MCGSSVDVVGFCSTTMDMEYTNEPPGDAVAYPSGYPNVGNNAQPQYYQDPAVEGMTCCYFF